MKAHNDNFTDAERERRTFSEQRRKQGFRDQSHLDAFYLYFDHTKTCPECQKAGKGFELADGSIQPTVQRCDVALALLKGF